MEDAINLVDEFDIQFAPLKCGVVIGSGHGLYPMLLFDEPFIIGASDDRDRLEHLSRRFHQAFASLAGTHGWTGAVEYCDPSKVLRLPGTVNLKGPQNPKAVRVISGGWERFTMDEIERVLPVTAAKKSGKAKPVGGKIPEGKRNSTLASLAGTMRQRGMSEEAIYAALVIINQQQCDPPLVDDEVRRIAKSVGSYPPGGGAAGQPKKSQATQLVELADSAELFHTKDQEAYAAMKMDDHHEIWRLKDSQFKRWLAQKFYTEHGKAPSTAAIQDALGVLAGKALFEGQEHEVYTRMARLDDAIYLDLANATWQAVKITATGWQTVNHPKVRFRRPRGMQELPMPKRGGKITELWAFVNIKTRSGRILVSAYLLGAFNVDGTFPVLVLQGEQGSAKSTTTRAIRRVIDPNKALLRRLLREERDLAIAAANGWVVTFDNVSSLPQWLSDSLCCLATGGGFSTRELWTDDQETLFDAKRPIMLNGIGGFVVRGDLLDRSLVVELPEIPPEKKKAEDEFWRSFQEAHPRILGALLDAVVAALKNRPNTKLDELPRLADFALWGTAGEKALGLQKGDVIWAMKLNRADANSAPLDASPIVPALRKLLLVSTGGTKSVGNWQGTASELLTQLHSQIGLRPPKGWPSSAHALSVHVHRIAPNLRAVGVHVSFERSSGSRSQRIITIKDEGGDFCVASDASDASEEEDEA